MLCLNEDLLIKQDYAGRDKEVEHPNSIVPKLRFTISAQHQVITNYNKESRFGNRNDLFGLQIKRCRNQTMNRNTTDEERVA